MNNDYPEHPGSASDKAFVVMALLVVIAIAFVCICAEVALSRR